MNLKNPVCFLLLPATVPAGGSGEGACSSPDPGGFCLEGESACGQEIAAAQSLECEVLSRRL